MATLICAALTSIVFSGIQSADNEGDLGISNFQGYFNDWSKNFCGSSPYLYFSPFSFTFRLQNGDQYTHNPPSCGWPTANLGLRAFTAVVTLIVITTLYFPTAVSKFATPIHFAAAMFWYSTFILDANSYTLGMEACGQTFASTNMGTYFSALQVSVTCDVDRSYLLTVFTDLICSLMAFTLWLVWDRTKDLYNKSSGDSLLTSTDRHDTLPPPSAPEGGSGEKYQPPILTV